MKMNTVIRALTKIAIEAADELKKEQRESE